jgi:serine phosphatase RsbU (regulator of sigma subunit)
MENLNEWKEKLLSDGTISAGEVPVIRELLFKDGIINRDEVNFLLDLNAATKNAKNDPAWYDLLVESILVHLDVIDKQHHKIEKLNEEITASIKYAKRIQGAIMPNNDEIATILTDYFILFKPRDIVSGDFYWVDKTADKIIIMVADCTGHGVPGAFMSMLGISLLNIIIKENHEIVPANILDRLRESVMVMLSQTVRSGETKDGMDAALCTVDLSTRKLQFAGAYNSLFVVRKGELIELKADRMPVGIYASEMQGFTNHEFELQPGDCIYMYSDGYASQFGGPCGQKFMTKNFKKVLTDVAHLPMNEQHAKLDQHLLEWQGSNSQVDDILVLGYRMNG